MLLDAFLLKAALLDSSQIVYTISRNLEKGDWEATYLWDGKRR